MQQVIKITFEGLCMFVPNGRGMYVLMPATGPDVGDGSVHPHRCTLETDPGAVESANILPEVDLAGAELTFVGTDATHAEPALVRGIVNVSRYTGGRVAPANLSGGGGGAITTRVILQSGTVESIGEVACWTFVRRVDGSEERAEMTNRVTWRLDREDGTEPFAIRVRDLVTGDDRFLLHFRTDVPTIEVRLSNVVEHEDSIVPETGYEPAHFRAYYWLLTDHQDSPLPRFAGGGRCVGSGVVGYSATIYTCMVAGGDPGP
jgi:hypothetical protein